MIPKSPCPNHEVDDPEVLLQAMAHKLDANVNEKPKLQVGGLEGCEVLGGNLGVKVSWLYPRVLSQVIHDLGTEKGSEVQSLLLPLFPGFSSTGSASLAHLQ